MPLTVSPAGRRTRVLVNGFGGYHGGIVRVHNAICRELVGLGYDVSVANAPRDQASVPGLEIMSRQESSRARSMLHDIRASLPVRSFDLRIDTAPAFRLFTRARRRVVVVHDLNFLDPSTHAISSKQVLYRRLLHAWTLRRADLIVVNSEATKAEVESIYSRATPKLRVLTLPVDLPSGERCWCRKERPDGTLRVLSFGHARNKGVDRLLRAMVVHSNLRLHVVAPGELWEDYWAALARDLGVEDRVTVVEGISDEELVGEYLATDVFCMLSTYEGYGLPVAEALSLGVPTVISSLPVLGWTSRGHAEVAEVAGPEQDFETIQRALARSDDHWRAAADDLGRFTWRQWTLDMVGAVGG